MGQHKRCVLCSNAAFFKIVYNLIIGEITIKIMAVIYMPTVILNSVLKGIPSSFFKEHILFTSASDIQQICQPFFDKTRTTYFNYVRRYHDGHKVCLSNRADWMRHFYEQKLFENILIERETINPGAPAVGNITIVLWAGQHDSKVVDEQRIHFDISNGISLAFTYENYIEYCYFGTEAKNTDMSNWYINNVSVLIEFIHYFKEKAKELLDEATQKENLISFGRSIRAFSASHQRCIFEDKFDYIKPKHYFVNLGKDEVEITAREMECIRYVARGYSSSQVGALLHISERTVEKHLEQAKEKLGCHSKSDLIEVILENGLNSLISSRK